MYEINKHVSILYQEARVSQYVYVFDTLTGNFRDTTDEVLLLLQYG